MDDAHTGVNELIEGFQRGDSVTVTYGERQEIVKGVIKEITDRLITITQSGRDSKITLELLKAIVYTSEPTSRPIPELKKDIILPPSVPYSFNLTEQLKDIKQNIKNNTADKVKRLLMSAFDKLQSAIKSNEIKNEYKYHDIRAQLLTIGTECSSNSDFFNLYRLLGIAAICSKKFDDAIEPFIIIKDFHLAAYSASQAKLEELQEMLHICSFLQDDNCNLDKYAAEICIKHKDIWAISYLYSIHKQEKDLCEILRTAIQYVVKEAGSINFNTAASISPYNTPPDLIAQLLEAFPASWKVNTKIEKEWKKYKAYSYPESSRFSYSGEIAIFNDERLFGFIKCSEGDRFFHIRYVNDIILRNLLHNGRWDGIKVDYTLCKSQNKRYDCCAGNIQLSAESKADARYRMFSERLGEITAYESETETGRVQCDNKSLEFTLQAVSDPYLKQYLIHCASFSAQQVIIKTNRQNGIETVTYMRWHDETQADFECAAENITEDDKDEWNNSIAADRLSDPYEEYAYSELEPIIKNSALLKWKTPIQWKWDDSSKHEPVPIPVPESKHEQTPDFKSSPGQKSIPIKPVLQQTSFLTQSWLQRSKIAEQGRVYAVNGDLERAEECYMQALKEGETTEGMIGDIVNLYLRMQNDSKLQDAITLLDTYKSGMSPEKNLNLRIQVYDKLKDYAHLLPLLEEAIRRSVDIKKKSHNLIKRIGVYIALGQYNEALAVCKRWDAFCYQNRFSTDGMKIAKSKSTVDRQRAVCFYHTGQIDEAKKIAMNLVRDNPGDITANDILNDTLIAQPFSEGLLFTDFNGDEQDSDLYSENTDIEPFVQLKINNTDIGLVLKSKDIKDGNYIGSVQHAKNDVDSLIGKVRSTVKARSDNLFAACKIIEQTENQAKNETIWPAAYKRTIAGRAIASWGDYMVSQSSQLDTARMAYLFALNALKAVEQDWRNSYNRYIKSYFMNKSELIAYIDRQTNSREKDGANNDIFAEKQLLGTLAKEFTVGILEILSVLSLRNDRKKIWGMLISDIIHKNDELRIILLNQLKALVPKIDTECKYSQSEMKALIDEGISQITNGRDYLRQILDEINTDVIVNIPPTDRLNALSLYHWDNILNAADVSRLDRIEKLLQRYLDYYDPGFEAKAAALRFALSEQLELVHEIRNEPTKLSFDVYLPFLESFGNKLLDFQTELYRQFQPNISWRESVSPFFIPEDESSVELELTAGNSQNYQTANDVCITDAYSNDIIRFYKSEGSSSVRGGEECGFIVKLRLTRDAISAGSFLLKIKYSYEFNDTPDNKEKAECEAEFTLVLHEKEKWIDYKNPYFPYVGKVMQDISLFKGRNKLIDEISEAIRLPNGEMNSGRAIIFYGATRAGKSSILYHLANKIREVYADRVIIWDMGNLAEINIDNDNLTFKFYRKMATIAAKAMCKNETASEICSLVPLREKMDKDPSKADECFKDYMSDLKAKLNEKKMIIVLFMDEFSYLQRKMSESFMSGFKAFLQNYPVIAIIAGQDDMPELMREYPNQFGCMEMRKITYLDETSAKQLICEPLKNANNQKDIFRVDRTADPIDTLYKLTAGSAYLIVKLCSYLVQYLNEKHAPIVTAAILNDFLKTKVFTAESCIRGIDFEPQYRERGHAELDKENELIFLAIARESAKKGYALFEEIVREKTCKSMTQERIEFLLQRLVSRDALSKIGNRYRNPVKLYEKWLLYWEGE